MRVPRNSGAWAGFHAGERQVPAHARIRPLPLGSCSGAHGAGFVGDTDIVTIVVIVAVIEHSVAVRAGVTIAVATLALVPLVRNLGLLVDHFDDAIVMLGMLQVAFCSDPVAGSLRVTSKGQIFFVNLEGISADTNIRTVAIKSLVSQRDVALTTPTIIAAPAA